MVYIPGEYTGKFTMGPESLPASICHTSTRLAVDGIIDRVSKPYVAHYTGSTDHANVGYDAFQP